MGKSLPTPGVSGGSPPFLVGVLFVGGTLAIFYPILLLFRSLLLISHAGGRSLAARVSSPNGVSLGGYRFPAWVFGLRR